MLLPLVQALYLFAPLVVAAAAAGLVLRFDLLPGLARPIDAGRSWRGERLLGDGKTWRGVVVAVAGCVAGVALQRWAIGDRAGSAAVVEYERVNVLLFGAAMGLGATLGELPNSFVKRRLGIGRGRTARGPLSVVFYVLDQADTLVVTWPLLLFWVRPTWQLVAASAVVVMTLHPAISLVGFLVGARRSAR